jgi:adenylate cyclase
MAEDRVQRRLAAILAADMVGYSRLIGADEEGTIARQKAHRAELIDPEIASHGGRIVKTMGDGLLVEFPSVVDAVKCAAAVQQAMSDREADVPEDRRIQYRVGINLGDIVIDGEDILGDGVNVAARLEGLAYPGGICVSGSVHEQVQGKLDIAFTDMGAQQVKNITKPVRAYQVNVSGAPSPSIGALTLSDMPSIAVLPFDNLSGDPEQEVFADGLTEDLITALSYWHTFYVIARHSTFQYKGQSPDIREVARDLGVQYALEGSVQTAGDRVRITAQLIDAANGRHVWAERYDRRLEDFFALQDEITQEIAAKAEPAFAKAEQQKVTRKPPTNLAAWEWYQRGIAMLDGFFQAGNVQGKAGNIQARECFQQAMESDPSDSRPVAYMAYAHFRFVYEGYSTEPEVDIAKIVEFAKRAIDLDDTNPYAHFAYSIGLTYSGRPELGIPEARRAVEINPNYSHAYIPLGNGLNLAGEPAEGVLHLEKAIKLNPTDPRNHAYFTFLAEAHLNNRDYEKAIEWSRKAIERNSDYPYAHFVLASALGHIGQIEAAGEALNECLKLRPDCIETHPQLHLFKNPADREHILGGLRKAGWSEPDAPPPLPDKPSIAVLPFDNLSNDPEQEYFSDGLAEDLITDLSKISGLFVIARNSAFAFKGQPIDVRRVAEELGVRHVLEGSVRKAGGKVRINAQLIDAASGGHIWAERYDGELEDIFSLQDNITAQIVAALQVSLTPTDKKLTERKPTDSVEAHDRFLRGRANFYRFTPELMLEAAECFQEAIEIDPNFAEAYSYLSYCHFLGWVFIWPGFDDTLERANELAEIGVALDDTSAFALARLGNVQVFLHRYEPAIANLEKAIALAPNSAAIYATFGIVLNYWGNPEKALDMLGKAISLETFAPSNWEFQFAHAHLLLRQYDEALARLERVAERAPKFAPVHIYLASAYVELGRLDAATAAIETLLENSSRYALSNVDRLLPYRNDEVRNRFLDSLRTAGLPES